MIKQMKILKELYTYLKDTKAKTYVVTNDKEIANISDMAIVIDEKGRVFMAFYQAAIVMQYYLVKWHLLKELIKIVYLYKKEELIHSNI